MSLEYANVTFFNSMFPFIFLYSFVPNFSFSSSSSSNKDFTLLIFAVNSEIPKSCSIILWNTSSTMFVIYVITIIAVSMSIAEILNCSIIYSKIIASPIILIVHFDVFTVFPNSLLVILVSFKLSISFPKILKHFSFKSNAFISLNPLVVSFTSVE